VGRTVSGVVSSVVMPTVRRFSVTQKALVAHPIRYSVGSPVLTEDVNLYYIWYGNWSYKTKEIMTDLGNAISDSA
jgi:hypothetical protein